MKNTLHEEQASDLTTADYPDMTTADYVSLTIMLVGIVTAWIAIAMEDLRLMFIGIIVALPATVVKVQLTRARSQAVDRAEQLAARDRRTPKDLRGATGRAAI